MHHHGRHPQAEQRRERHAAGVFTIGTVVTTADTSAGSIEAKTSATVQNVNLLSGVVTATAVKSVSSTTHDATGFHTSAAGTGEHDRAADSYVGGHAEV
jgi:hypothetical protein